MVVFAVVMLSWIMISRTIMPLLGIQLAGQPVWRSLHTTSADLSVFLVGLHFALHWKWVVSAISQLFMQPVRRLAGKPQLKPEGIMVKADER